MVRQIHVYIFYQSFIYLFSFFLIFLSCALSPVHQTFVSEKEVGICYIILTLPSANTIVLDTCNVYWIRFDGLVDDCGTK